MSDYLSTIAAKALNLMPVIEPRPISLFEPTPGLGGAFDHVSTDRSIAAASGAAALLSDATAAPQPPQGQHPARPLTHDRSLHLDTTPPVAGPMVFAGHVPGAWSTPHTVIPVTSSSAAEPLPDSVALAMASNMAPVAMGPASGHTPGPPAQDRQPSLTVRSSLAISRAVEPDVPFEPSISPSFLASRLQGDEPMPRVHSLGSLGADARRSELTHSPTGNIVVQALVTPATESPVHTADDAAAAQASRPTIHITIGRVEVRAATSPTPAAPRPKAARPAVKASLTDYLKSSQRGR
jgi:hypothetical protein